MTIELPKMRNYGGYANALHLTIGALEVYFSYATPIAFRISGIMVVSKNYWGVTTGKHLNFIDGGRKSERVSHEEFERLWQEHVASRFAVWDEKRHPIY